MASSNSNRGSSSSHQAPPADAAQHSLNNPQFLAMTATELVAHLELQLEETKALVLLREKRIETLEDQLRMAAVREQLLRTQIQELQLQRPGGATGTRRGGGVGGSLPRTSYRAQRMRAKAPPAALPSSGDESSGDEEGNVGDDLPAARKTWQPSSLRMNPTAGFRGSPPPRRRRRNAKN